MTYENKRQGSDLFIVDNSDDDWKVQNYLREWTDISHTFDIATGYFEIGALLALDGQWQKLDSSPSSTARSGADCWSLTVNGLEGLDESS